MQFFFYYRIQKKSGLKYQRNATQEKNYFCKQKKKIKMQS